MRRGALLAVLLPFALIAHNGPPFAIITDQKAGPCIVSVWANPDIGTGSFFVFPDPLPGGSLPKDLKVEIGLEPANHSVPEKRYPTTRDEQGRRVEYKLIVPFEKQEFWNVRVLLASSQGQGEAKTTVEVTPVGLGRWDLLLYSLPFLGVGFLWLRAIMRRR